MRSASRKKRGLWRRRLLFPVWLIMVASAAYYLYECRNFSVDDTLFDQEIREAAAKHGLDSRLVRALIYEESRFRPGAIGRAGEIGLMQVMPKQAAADWARANHVPCPEREMLFRPRINLEIGCWFLSDGIRRFRQYDEATELALARYNAGLSRANAWKPKDKKGSVADNITIASTKRYVKNIMKRYRRYCKESAERDQEKRK